MISTFLKAGEMKPSCDRIAVSAWLLLRAGSASAYRLRCTLALGLLAAGFARLAAGDAAPPPIALALTVNDAASETAYRGWPLLIRGDVVATGDTVATVELPLATLGLSVVGADGATQHWPLRRVPERMEPVRLGGEADAARVTWLLTSQQTATLAPGNYTVTFAWAGRKAAPLEFVIADAPAAPSLDDRIRRALLWSEVAVLLGDLEAALAVTQPPEPELARSLPLLLQRAAVHERRLDFRGMLQATQTALAVFRSEQPRSDHPPRAILALQSRALAGLARTPPSVVPKVSQTPSPAAPVSGSAPSEPAAAAVAGGGSIAAVAGPSTAPSSAVSPAGPLPGTLVPATGLSEAAIRAESSGQWAVAARAGSEYGKLQYSAARATGAPDVPLPGNSAEAWVPVNKDRGTEWIELTFARPVRAQEVRVRQNDTPGAIVKVEAVATDGAIHVWWEGVDPYVPARREIVWFAVRVPATAYRVEKIRLTLNLATRPGWKAIDAVQLLAAGEP